MMRQYYAQRARGGFNPFRVGVIAAGSIYYLQDPALLRARFGPAPSRRNPWIVEAFLNGECGAARYNAATGRWESIYLSGRCDVAVLRSLRDGRRTTRAVHSLIAHDELGLATEPTAYPSLPDLALYRINASASLPQPCATKRGERRCRATRALR
jgi:hypothetical protein